jgi:hypothetical protein
VARGDLFRRMYFALLKQGYSKEEASKIVKEAMENVIGKKRVAKVKKEFALKYRGIEDLLKDLGIKK